VEGIKMLLAKGTLSRIDAFVGTCQRSRFIRQAVEKELPRLVKKAFRQGK